MQVWDIATLGKRFLGVVGMVVILGGVVLAQTGQGAPNSLPVDNPGASSASTATTQMRTPAAAEAPMTGPSAGWTELALPVIKFIGGGGLVLSLILFAFVMFRKFAPQYMNKVPKERFLRHIETLPMGEKRSIVLVQAGMRKLLLASTPGQITLLTSLADTAGAASLNITEPPEAEMAVTPAGSFRNLYELEKKASAVRPSARTTLPPDIRGKMQELRKALEG
jgi:flagellar biogenesis protein FliO